jgi:hypothetical protein
MEPLLSQHLSILVIQSCGKMDPVSHDTKRQHISFAQDSREIDDFYIWKDIVWQSAGNGNKLSRINMLISY